MGLFRKVIIEPYAEDGMVGQKRVEKLRNPLAYIVTLIFQEDLANYIIYKESYEVVAQNSNAEDKETSLSEHLYIVDSFKEIEPEIDKDDRAREELEEEYSSDFYNDVQDIDHSSNFNSSSVSNSSSSYDSGLSYDSYSSYDSGSSSSYD